MSIQTQGRSLKRELYEQYEELLFRIALVEMNEEEAAGLEQDRSSEAEMEDFFQKTQAGTLRVIGGAGRRERAFRILKTELPRVSRIAAALLLLVYIGATAAIAAVPEVRMRVAHFLIQTNEVYTSLSLSESTDATFSVPEKWQGESFPTYIPEGFKMQPFGQKRTRVYYLNSSGDLLDFTEYTADSYVNIDTEGAEVRKIEMNGMPAIFSTKGDRVTVAWSDDDRYFVLVFEGDADTAMQIVKSVRKIK
jgi:hypothetical protein